MTQTNVIYRLLAILRITLGWIFFWAFLDKLFGLGFATSADKAWLNGGSPTVGFLKFGTSGPFAQMYQNIAGTPLVDWLFMMGLLLIGLALILGIGIYVATYSGALLMLLMYLASLPKENNPFIDEHIIYILLLLTINFAQAGDYLGLGKWWSQTALVKKYKFLK